MKGLITIALCLLSFGASASSVKPQDLFGIKVSTGEVIRNLNLIESAKVLKSLHEGENIEIRQKVIYPEQVTKLILGKLTKGQLTERRPNPQDYN
jgi:hypothetical protein